MYSGSNPQAINHLLSQLGTYLDSYRRPGKVDTAYMQAQNSISSPAGASQSFSDLAARLREAAQIA